MLLSTHVWRTRYICICFFFLGGGKFFQRDETSFRFSELSYSPKLPYHSINMAGSYVTLISKANLNKLTVRLICPKFIQVSSLVSLTRCCKFVNMTAGFYAFLANLHNFHNRPIPSFFEPSNGSEDKCKVFIMKIRRHRLCG